MFRLVYIGNAPVLSADLNSDRKMVLISVFSCAPDALTHTKARKKATDQGLKNSAGLASLTTPQNLSTWTQIISTSTTLANATSKTSAAAAPSKIRPRRPSRGHSLRAAKSAQYHRTGIVGMLAKTTETLTPQEGEPSETWVRSLFQMSANKSKKSSRKIGQPVRLPPLVTSRASATCLPVLKTY